MRKQKAPLKERSPEPQTPDHPTTGLLTPWAERRRGCKEGFGRWLELEGGRSELGLGGGWGSGPRGSSFGLHAWMCADAPAKGAAPAMRLCLQDNASLCIYTILSRSSWFATKELGVDAEAQGRDQGLPVSCGVQAAFPSLSSKRLTLTSPAKKSLLKGSLTI